MERKWWTTIIDCCRHRAESWVMFFDWVSIFRVSQNLWTILDNNESWHTKVLTLKCIYGSFFLSGQAGESISENLPNFENSRRIWFCQFFLLFPFSASSIRLFFLIWRRIPSEILARWSKSFGRLQTPESSAGFFAYWPSFQTARDTQIEPEPVWCMTVASVANCTAFRNIQRRPSVPVPFCRP